MRRKITDKEIIETLLEVRSHSGLPISYFPGAFSMLKCFQKYDMYEKHIDYIKQDIINNCMREVHKERRKGINKNIKSCDW